MVVSMVPRRHAYVKRRPKVGHFTSKTCRNAYGTAPRNRETTRLTARGRIECRIHRRDLELVTRVPVV
jgi:hypothetical protein